MKKISAMLAIMLLFSVFTAFAAEGDLQKVEITFAVGDSTITINGENVAVVTPYVVNGTTLVPVRVITESFGADVDWDADTQTVTITYLDMTIVLSIDSNVATVNGNKTELLAAPELTDGSTMLPLRFITESFGADVTYDSETEKITVVKEITNSNSIKDYAAILKRSEKEYVGDSYNNWSIKRTPEFRLEERSFDGYRNSFSSGERDASYIVSVGLPPEDWTIDDAIEEFREEAGSYSTIELRKSTTPKGVPFAHTQFKAEKAYVDLRTYFTDRLVYYVAVIVGVDEGLSTFKEICQIADSFDIGFNTTVTEDLSDVVNGMRTFHSKEMAITMSVPGDYIEAEDADKSNEFMFVKYNKQNKTVSIIHINVFSVSDGHTFDYFAQKDRQHNRDAVNEKYASFSDIKETVVDNAKALYYTYDLKFDKYSEHTRDVFIDGGDYFYNIAFSIDKDEPSYQLIDEMIKSISIGKIDSEKVGKLIRSDADKEIRYKEHKNSAFDFSLEAPTTWNVDNSNGVLAAYDNSGIRFFSVSAVSTKSWSAFKLQDIVSGEKKDLENRKNISLVDHNIVSKQVGSKTAMSLSFIQTEDNGQSFVTVYYFHDKDVLYQVVAACDEKYNGKQTQEIFEKMLGSIKVN